MTKIEAARKALAEADKVLSQAIYDREAARIVVANALIDAFRESKLAAAIFEQNRARTESASR